MESRVITNLYKFVGVLSLLAFALISIFLFTLLANYSNLAQAESSANSSSDFTVTVDEVLSLNISSPCDSPTYTGHDVTLDIAPRSNGVMSSCPNIVTVDTNTFGFQLLFKSSSTNLVHATVPSLTIPSTTNSVPSKLTSNTWGYSIPTTDDVNHSTTGIPDEIIDVFDDSYERRDNQNPIPNDKYATTPTADALIKQIEDSPGTITGNKTSIYYGATADMTTTAGTYKTTITYTAISEEVPAVPITFKQISSANGGSHTCAIASNNNAYCWGSGGSGQLGNGTNSNSNVPVKVIPISDGFGGYLTFKQISSGHSHTCAIASNNNTYCWGAGNNSQLGNGTNSNSNVPVSVSPISNASGGYLTFKQISSGYYHTCAIASNDNAYCWGYSQLGNGTNSNSNVPVSVSPIPDGSGGQLTFEQISSGNQHNCTVASDKNAYCWGTTNNNGQLGNDTNVGSLVPVSVSPIPDGSGGQLTFEQISSGNDHTCAITSNDNAYCWGYGYYGQLGDGSRANKFTPASVSPISNGSGGYLAFKQISSDYSYTCAIASDDNAYCWGYGSSGQLGNGTFTSKYVPASVSPISNGSGDYLAFKQISSGHSHTCAITSNDNAYCWGYGSSGQLGNSTNTAWDPTPTKVINPTM